MNKILLGGGPDMNPRFYEEGPDVKLEEVNPDRDVFELAVIKAALEQEKAILGICRGLQILNVALGGTLYQDLGDYPNAIRYRQVSTS